MAASRGTVNNISTTLFLKYHYNKRKTLTQNQEGLQFIPAKGHLRKSDVPGGTRRWLAVLVLLWGDTQRSIHWSHHKAFFCRRHRSSAEQEADLTSVSRLLTRNPGGYLCCLCHVLLPCVPTTALGSALTCLKSPQLSKPEICLPNLS